jgi:uncharacterized membrane protein YhiD involved in acid resistance
MLDSRVLGAFMESLLNQIPSYSEIEFLNVSKNILLSGVMSQLVYLSFVRYGRTLSNRKQFGSIFFMIAVSTTLIISIIKSSLALSLGLVGALSIVRFRTAVKEPEELAYLFLIITLGIGYGADTYLLTTVSSIVILCILILRGILFNKTPTTSLYNLSIDTRLLTLETIQSVLLNNCEQLNLMRVISEGNLTQLFFSVIFKNSKNIEKSILQLKALDDKISVHYSTSANVI